MAIQKKPTAEEIRAHQIAFVSTGISLGAGLSVITDVIKMITPDDNYTHNISTPTLVSHTLEHKQG